MSSKKSKRKLESLQDSVVPLFGITPKIQIQSKRYRFSKTKTNGIGRDNTWTLALHVADPCLIPGVPYDWFPDPHHPKVILKCKAKSNLSIARCDPPNKIKQKDTAFTAALLTPDTGL